MARIPAAQGRLFKNVFICKRCSAKIKANPSKIIEGKIKCRRCNTKKFRPIKKK